MINKLLTLDYMCDFKIRNNVKRFFLRKHGYKNFNNIRLRKI